MNISSRILVFLFAASVVASTSTTGAIEEHGSLKGSITRVLGKPEDTPGGNPNDCSENSWSCDDGCIKVDSCVPDPTDANKKVVTVDVSGCKGGTISWACCTGATIGSTTTSCDFYDCVSDEGQDGDYTKCNEVSSLSVSVAADATSITINTHDGISTGGANMDNDQCGGNGNQPSSCNADSGHCLVTLPVPEDCGCTVNEAEQAACVSNSCEDKVYNFETCKCEITPKPQGTECKAADLTQCRVASVCNGMGTCVDPEPSAAAGLVCLKKTEGNDCDVDDVCDGSAFSCPPTFAPNGTVCGSPNPFECIGAKQCNNDGECINLPATSDTVCRSVVNGCDIEERCNGSDTSCPCDDERDNGYTMKCGQLIYLCGPTSQEITYGSGGQFYIGDCSIGKGTTFVTMTYPECLDDDLQSLCPVLPGAPKSFGLSNYATATCSASGGDVKWTCTSKVNTSNTTTYPIDLGFTSACPA